MKPTTSGLADIRYYDRILRIPALVHFVSGQCPRSSHMRSITIERTLPLQAPVPGPVRRPGQPVCARSRTPGQQLAGCAMKAPTTTIEGIRQR